MSTVILESVLTCPHCGHAQKETMPSDEAMASIRQAAAMAAPVVHRSN